MPSMFLLPRSSVSITPFTDTPFRSASANVIFPSPGMQLLSSLIHLLGSSILAVCLARCTLNKDLLTFKGWVTLPWPKLCVILVFLVSWLFVFSAGVLISGFGLSASHVTCSLAIWGCICLYALSKVLIYSFLVEKVYIVWSTGATVSRFQSNVYRVCMVIMCGYIAVLILMIVGRIAEFRQDGTCIIGLKRLASIPLLTYDMFLNVFLTGLFIWPLYQYRLMSPKLKAVAKRTFVAALAALTTSTVNILILTLHRGRQLGWVCLGSCGTDVTLNALVLFWVTSGTCRNTSIVRPQLTPAFPEPSVGKGNEGIRLSLAAQRPTSSRSDNTMRGQTGTHLSVIDSTDRPGRHSVGSYNESVYDYLPSTQVPTSVTRSATATATAGEGNAAMGKETKGFFKRLGERLRFGERVQDPEAHTMSIQVTVTQKEVVEHQSNPRRTPSNSEKGSSTHGEQEKGNSCTS